MRWFIALFPRLLACNVIIQNPFLVTSDHILQKRVVFFIVKKGMPDAQKLHPMDFLQLMRNPNLKLA